MAIEASGLNIANPLGSLNKGLVLVESGVVALSNPIALKAEESLKTAGVI